MPKWSGNYPKMIPKLASFASKIGWWQSFRARALGTQGYRYATMGPGPARTARKHCHQPIFEAKLVNFGIILTSFCHHFGIILVSFWHHLGMILPPFWDHFSIILRSLWYHFGIILASFKDHVGIIALALSIRNRILLWFPELILAFLFYARERCESSPKFSIEILRL